MIVGSNPTFQIPLCYNELPSIVERKAVFTLFNWVLTANVRPKALAYIVKLDQEVMFSVSQRN